MNESKEVLVKSLLSDDGIFLDLNVVECGYEECLQDKNVPENPRNYFTFHYINYGRGEIAYNGKTYKLSEGDSFLIYPDTGVSYKADEVFPWHYSWVVFNGRLAQRLIENCGFSLETIVMHINNPEFRNILSKLINCYQSKGVDAETIGRFFVLLSQLKKKKNEQSGGSSGEILVRKAVYYIKTNYASKLDAALVAKKMNVSYNQLLISFKKYLGVTPKAYILDVKLRLANELIMLRGFDKVSELAAAVGFSDEKYFSKCYKKYFGQTPFETISAVIIKEKKE